MPHYNLYLLQFACAIVCLCMAMCLLVTRFHVGDTSRRYEQSRWVLFGSMLLLSLHYFLQMQMGFRQQGPDVGTVINILFYAPALFCLSYSILNITGHKNFRIHYLWAGIAFSASILTAFLIGYRIYGSLHMKHALNTMGVLYFVATVYFVVKPFNHVRKMSHLVESETGSDIVPYLRYMYTGQVMLSAAVLGVPLMLIWEPMLYVGGPVLLLAMFYFITCFLAFGFNQKQVAEAVREGTQKQEIACNPDAAMPEERVREMEAAIGKWRMEMGFRDSNLTIASMARRMGVSPACLSKYIAQEHGSTFRVWLSNLRIEEAKRILVTHPEYNVETVAGECGFSSSSHFHRFFHQSTGMTPTEYRKSRIK